MLGRPASCAPVWMKVMAGSWLIASVFIDRTMHHSSARPDMWGISSLNHAPDSPCRANLNSDGATGNLDWPEVIVVSRCPIRIEAGRSSPRLASIAGLGSKRSIWDGAPDWNR